MSKGLEDIDLKEHQAALSEAVGQLDNIQLSNLSLRGEIDHFIKKTSSLAKYIVSEDSKTGIELSDKREYRILFTEPVFLASIVLSFHEKPIDLIFEAKDIFDKEVTITPTFLNSKKRQFKVMKPINEFKLVGKAGIWSKKEILEDVVISGCSVEQMGDVIREFSEVVEHNREDCRNAEKLKSELTNDIELLSNRVAKSDGIESRINDLSIEYEELVGEFERTKGELITAKQQLDVTSSDNKLLSNNNESLKNSIEQLNNERSILNSELSELKLDLKRLYDDKNAFTEDVIEFNRRSNDQKRFYLNFASLLIFGILCLASIVFHKALITAQAVPGWEESFQLFLARIPLLTMVITISVACYFLISAFFKKIMDIDRQQLNFAKLGIVAKDVTVYSGEGLDISDEAEFERRIKLKMKLLKDFLSEELGKQYDYTKSVEEDFDKALSSLPNMVDQVKDDSTDSTDITVSK